MANLEAHDTVATDIVDYERLLVFIHLCILQFILAASLFAGGSEGWWLIFHTVGSSVHAAGWCTWVLWQAAAYCVWDCSKVGNTLIYCDYVSKEMA